jgi:hypothetical protein
MWGTDASKQLRLTTSTLPRFQTAIALEELPDIFKEAIRITRYLGFRFLWIDSLCIVQDSESDWTAEANMMSTVYNNAVCTIAFLFPPQVGFMQSREDPRALTPCIAREPTESKRGIYVVPTKQNNLWSLRSRHGNWPLSSRAWTFQEQILSPRTILYGNHTIMWECVEQFSDELAGTWMAQTASLEKVQYFDEGYITQKALVCTRSIHRTLGLPRVSSQDQSKEEYFWTFPHWQNLMDQYRGRNLTKPSDRIMAVSGVAQAYQAEHGLTYLAGMWKEHLPRPLLWYNRVPRGYWEKMPRRFLTHRPKVRELPLKSVPTWSWFASPIYTDNDTWRVPIFADSLGRQSYLATFVHFKWPNKDVNYTPPTAYYDFDGLQITLKLPTYTTTVVRKIPNRQIEFVELCCASLEKELASLLGVDGQRIEAQYICDDLREFDEPPATVRIALLEEEWNLDQETRSFRGLALAPGTDKGTHKRVGYWRGSLRSLERFERNRIKRYQPHRREETTAPAAQEETLDNSAIDSLKESVFLRLEGVELETLTLV